MNNGVLEAVAIEDFTARASHERAGFLRWQLFMAQYVSAATSAHWGQSRHRAEGPPRRLSGFDAAYLLEGDLSVLERGQPVKPIHPGHSWHVRPGIVHEVKAGHRTTKVLAMYVVEKGKPLATPWQPPQSN